MKQSSAKKNISRECTFSCACGLYLSHPSILSMPTASPISTYFCCHISLGHHQLFPGSQPLVFLLKYFSHMFFFTEISLRILYHGMSLLKIIQALMVALKMNSKLLSMK